MPLTVAVHRRLEDLSAPDWQRVLHGGQGALALGVLGPCQTALPDLKWRLLTALREHQVVGVAAAYLQRTSLSELLPRPLARVGRGLPALQVLEVGPPVCPGPPAAVREDAAWPALLDAARGVAEDEGCALLAVRDFAGGARTPEEDSLAERGFVPVTSRDTYLLPLPFDSFDDYLGALRADYRRRAQASLALPLRVKVVRDFAPQAASIAQLVELTTRRAEASREERIDEALLARWAQADGTAALLLEDEAGTCLATAVVLSDGPVVHFLRCGFDEAVGRTSGAYLRLLFELVRFSIDEGAQCLDLGVTSAEPKLRLGAEAVPLRVWAWARSAWLRRGLQLVAPALVRRPSPEARRVFRAPLPPVTPDWYRPGGRGGAASTAAGPAASPPRPTAR